MEFTLDKHNARSEELNSGSMLDLDQDGTSERERGV